MRTSLKEIEYIEGHILGKQSPQEKLVFEAKLILDVDLQDKVSMQNEAYSKINAYGRLQLKKEIFLVQQKLFAMPRYETFREKIFKIFNNKNL